jgi:MFS family permease
MNTLAMSISMMAFCLVDTKTTAPVILAMTFIYGFLMSLQYTSMNSLAYANIEENQQSAATSIMSTMQQMAQSLGVAIAAIFLRVFAPEGILNLAAFHHTFLLLGMISYVAILLFLQLQVQDGEELLIKSNLLPENMK